MKSEKKHLLDHRWPVILLFCVVFLAALGGSFVLYQRSIERAVDKTTLSFMEQLADHDSRNVESQFKSRLSYIHSLSRRISLIQQDKAEDILYLLGVEVQSTQFQKLYLVMTDGTVYDSAYLKTNLEDVGWASAYRSAEGDFVTRFEVDKREEWGEYLLYGSYLDTPVSYKGGLIESIIGLIPVEALDGLRSLESFGGRGTTLVIQPYGEIITASRYYDTGSGKNYFTELENAAFLSGYSFEQCREAIKQGDSAYAEYIFQGVKYCVMLKPIQNELIDGWYTAVKVPSEVTAEQTQIFLRRSIFFLILFSIMIVLIAVILFKMVKEAQMARASERAKSTFLVNMSHEIRTPLNGITGLLYLMDQNLDEKEKLKEYLDKAKVSAGFLKSIINDVLDMSKVERNQFDLCRQPFNLEEVLSETRMLIEPQAEERGQQFVMECDKLEANCVMGDGVRLKQIIVNLLGNSLKFTPSGGRITLTVRQQVKETVVETLFSISDTGCGMSKEFMERIWHPFEQENRVSDQNGTGLGTTLSKALAEKMGGTITVESSHGQGTTFTVLIPLPLAEAKETAINESMGEMTLQEKSILVVEDNNLNREILQEILETYGAKVTAAANGQEAVEIFAKYTPHFFDVILMDIQMPLLNGYEATEKIRMMERSDGKKIPILALTANAFQEDVDRAIASGMDGVVTKPLDVSALLKKLIELKL